MDEASRKKFGVGLIVAAPIVVFIMNTIGNFQLTLVAFPFGAILALIGWGQLLRARREEAQWHGFKGGEVLYLRPFNDDGSIIRFFGIKYSWLPFMPPLTHEMLMCRALARFGSIIAIGRPGEELPEIGAQRVYIGDSEWKERVTLLMTQARLIAIRLGNTAGLLWELTEALKAASSKPVILVFPNDAMGWGMRLAVIESTRAAIREVLGIEVSASLLRRQVVLIHPGGRVRAVAPTVSALAKGRFLSKMEHAVRQIMTA